jgi:hypothetical protein
MTDTEEESEDEESEEEETEDEDPDTASSEGDGEEPTYEIEKIVGHRNVGDKGDLDYHVKWKGVRRKTWEPKENLVTCNKVVREYNASMRKAK